MKELTIQDATKDELTRVWGGMKIGGDWMGKEIKRMKKGERIPTLYGRIDAYMNEKDIEALLKGRALYVNVFDEYAVAIRYKKGANDEID